MKGWQDTWGVSWESSGDILQVDILLAADEEAKVGALLHVKSGKNLMICECTEMTGGDVWHLDCGGKH
jgi:hypothetical protein